MGDNLWVFNTAMYGKMYDVPLILLSSVYKINNAQDQNQ